MMAMIMNQTPAGSSTIHLPATALLVLPDHHATTTVNLYQGHH